MRQNPLSIATLVLFCAASMHCGSESDTSTPKGTTSSNPQDNNSTIEYPGFCEETCANSGQCTQGYSCVDARCERISNARPATCSDDFECIAAKSVIDDTPCTAGGNECASYSVCVDIGGTGRCFFKPTTNVPCSSRFSRQEMAWTDIDGAAVSICAETEAACIDDTCGTYCKVDAHCSITGYNTCDTATGQCVCSAATASCTNRSFGGTVCGADGVCGCDTAADCIGQGFEICLNGRCGCADATSCSGLGTLHPNTVYECAPQN